MGLASYLTTFALLASSALAQDPVASYTSDNHGISVNVPSDTASSGSGPIYFQISAPSGTQWVAFGQGSRMAGATMFVVYSKDSSNVTISGRAGTGHSMPQHDSSIQLTLLEGTGISSDGSMVANVRCDSCDSSGSSWIYASKSGDALDTDDVSASISQHEEDTSFTLDLSSGTGGSSSNPFLAAAASPSESASASGSGSTPSPTESAASATGSATKSGSQTSSTATGGVSNPLASSGSSTNTGNSGTSASSEQHADNTSSLLSAHGIIMSVLFLGCFPLFALTLYLPYAQKVRFIHAPLQILSVILLIIGMALGIVLGQRIDQLDGYHQVIGFIVVAVLVLFQPALGLYQHLHYRKTGGRSVFGQVHRWLGRSMIILGIINGGLGWQLAGSTGAYIPYAIVAAIVFLIYLSVLLFAWYRSGKHQDLENEKAHQQGGYEMQQPRAPKHQRLPSDPNNAYQQQQMNNNPTRSGGYTINSRR